MLDAGRDVRMESFVGGAMKAFAVNLAEAEKAEATMQKHMEDLGGIQNIVKLPMEQRGAVEDFLRTNRDEYNTLAEQYEKTKDPAIKDQMNAIKFKFETLNNQLGQFATSKAEYMYDYEEGNLMKGGTFAKDNAFYMGMYGDPNAQFSISETGEISFTVNGETRAFKDVGSHTLRNYEGEKNIDTLFGAAADLKVQGKFFDKARFANNFVNGHKSITKNDLKALLQTDLTGDGDKPSFMDQWANGELADEFYQGVDKNNIKPEDVEALLNDKQRGLDLMGKYVGNISEGIYGNTDTDPSVLLNNRYKQAQIDAMNKKSNNQKNTTSPNVSVFKDYEYIDWYGDSKLTGPEATKMRQDIADREDILNRYTWKGDHWYDTQEEKKIGSNDDLAKEMNIKDPRFYDIAATTDGQPTEINFVKKPFTLPELAKEGIDRTLFQGDAVNAVAKLKPFLPENYDIVTGDDITFSGRRGKGRFSLGKELFSGDNYFEVVNTETGEVIGKFKTQYTKDPTGAQAQLVEFQNKMKNILGFTPKPSLQ